MTFYEDMDLATTNTFDIDARKRKAAGYTLMTTLKQAIRKGRLICGMNACAQHLSSEAAKIMLCVLPLHNDEVSVQIHHTLIKAFCHERGIPMIQLQNSNSIGHLIKKVVAKDRHCCPLIGDVDDQICLLIMHGKKPTKDDQMLINYCNEMMLSGRPMPTVDLPA